MMTSSQSVNVWARRSTDSAGTGRSSRGHHEETRSVSLFAGHHDGGAGAGVHTLIASRCSRATFEMQKRYLPLASCGIASTNSTSQRTPGPNVSADQFADLSPALGAEVVVGHEANAQLGERLLHDLHLGGAGDQQGEVLGQRDAGDQPARGRQDVIRLAALDPLDERQPAAALAAARATARPRRRSDSGSAASRGW